MRPCVHSIIIGLLSPVFLAPHLAGEDVAPDKLKSPWIKATEYRYKEAYKEFRALQKVVSEIELRRARFGEALMLLSVQPKTVEKIETAREIFLSFANEGDKDELSIRSFYYLGRINQTHQSEPDWDAASRFYEELIEQWPEHPYAQLALAKHAVTQLYQPTSQEEKGNCLRNLEKLGKNLTFRPAIRDFHYVVGVACLSLGLSKENALEHLLVVADSDLHQSRSLASIYVRVGETARQLGKYDLALKYYRIFLDRFPRELRTTIIRDRVAEVEALLP